MSKPDSNANSHAGQHQGFEVFWVDDYTETKAPGATDPGWYWWSCQPGCLPDGEPSGPFMTSLDAWDDRRTEDDLP